MRNTHSSVLGLPNISLSLSQHITSRDKHWSDLVRTSLCNDGTCHQRWRSCTENNDRVVVPIGTTSVKWNNESIEKSRSSTMDLVARSRLPTRVVLGVEWEGCHSGYLSIVRWLSSVYRVRKSNQSTPSAVNRRWADATTSIIHISACGRASEVSVSGLHQLFHRHREWTSQDFPRHSWRIQSNQTQRLNCPVHQGWIYVQDNLYRRFFQRERALKIKWSTMRQW